MPNYCLELYLPRASASQIGEAAVEAQRAAGASAGAGRVRYLRTTYLADDETCLHFFEAASVEHVADAARRAGLATERITRSVDPQNDDLPKGEAT
jgi:Protein of unknown function (DUF4242)